ncbi:MAG: hypothetical protein L3V56_04015 [Candidatus Magnetoovum sp. WYHC-5]|nr:hypothetical protein [Candidatus Magnetoovum sp. WYHC-5]
MDSKSKTKGYFRGALNILVGIGSVVVGSYVFSRINEKQDTQTRLERMESILDKLEQNDGHDNK